MYFKYVLFSFYNIAICIFDVVRWEYIRRGKGSCMESIIQNICLVGFVFYYVSALTSVSSVRAAHEVEEYRAESPAMFDHEDARTAQEHEAEAKYASRVSSRTSSTATPVRERAGSVDSTGSLQRSDSRISVVDAVELDGVVDLPVDKTEQVYQSVDTTHWGTLGQIAADIQGGYSLQEVLEFAEQNPKYKGDLTRQQIVDEYYRQKGLGAAQPAVRDLLKTVFTANVCVLTDMKPADLVNVIEQSKNIPTSLQISAKLPSRYGGVSDPVTGHLMTIQDAVRYVTGEMQNPSSKMYTTLQRFAPVEFTKLQTLLTE